MTAALAAAALCLALVLTFVLTHLRALSAGEVERLALRRRWREVQRYFSFATAGVGADPDFKKSMRPDGRFYRVDEGLTTFPGLAAALLKYKKHEWIVFAFAKDRRVALMWVNKGADNASVVPHLSPEATREVARDGGFTTVLRFHNHPNPDPHHLDCTKPSDQDLRAAQLYISALRGADISLFEFVCERGVAHAYTRQVADAFLPACELATAVARENGGSGWANLRLHCELLFG